MRALWPEPDEHTGASNLDAARPTLRARRRFYQKPMEAVITAVTGLLHKVGAVWPFWGGRREEDRVPASPLRIEGRNGRKRSLPAETVVSSDSPSRGDNAENVFPRVPKRMKQSGAGALEDDGMVILQGKESPEVVVLGENSSTKSRRPKRLVRSPTTTYSVTEPSSDVQVVEEIIDLVKSPLKSSSKANHVDASSFSGAGSNKPFSDYDTFIRSCHVAPSAAAGKLKLKFAGDAFGRKSLPATTSRIVNGHASPPPLPPQYRVADKISSGDGQRPRFSAVTSTYQFHSSNASKDSLNTRDVSLPLNWKNKFPGASQPSVIGSPFLPRGGVMSSTPFNFRRKPVEVDLRADGETHSRVEQTSRASRSSYLERRSRDGVSFAAFAEMLAREEQRQLKDREAKIQLAREHVKESEEAAVRAQRALAESLRVKLRVTDVVLEEEEIEEIIEEGLDIEYQVAALTREAEDQIKKALLPVPKEQLLSEKFNIPIRRKDMVTLAPGAWLNDEIINFYLNMIVERSDSKGGHYPSVYAHPTFFFTTLQTKGYAGVRRWTRRVDIFAKDLVLIPVHLQVHWTAVVVDMKEKVVEFFDSMGSKRWDIVDSVLNYLCQEMKDKKNQELDVSEWKREIPDVPHQKNGWDCGMFACKFVEYRSRKAAIDFSQAEMPYFRRRMVWEILNKAFYRPN